MLLRKNNSYITDSLFKYSFTFSQKCPRPKCQKIYIKNDIVLLHLFLRLL